MQKIIIKNFRQISYAEIEVKDFLFLIGEQASGKSTIAKLIYFFKSLKQDYIDLLRDNNDVNEFIKIIQDKFAVYFGSTKWLSDDFYIEYFFSVERNYSLKLFKKNSLRIEFDRSYFPFIKNKTNELNRDIKSTNNMTASFTFQEKTSKMLMSKIKATANEVFFDEKETLYFPAGRNITVSYPEQFQLLFFSELKSPSFNNNQTNTIDVELIKEFISYSKFLIDYFSISNAEIEDTSFGKLVSNIISQILHGDYKNEGGKERIYYNENEYVPLNISSSGQQEAIRIIQDIIYILNEKRSASRIIEEPETHLFPKAQKLLIELLILVANKTNSQIIITTHSPYVMATFNNMLYYTKVIKEKPNKKEEIEAFFSTKGLNMNIDPDKFQAYRLKIGAENYCESIFDKQIQLIGENSLDQETEDLNNEFDFLYSMM